MSHIVVIHVQVQIFATGSNNTGEGIVAFNVTPTSFLLVKMSLNQHIISVTHFLLPLVTEECTEIVIFFFFFFFFFFLGGGGGGGEGGQMLK